MTPAQITKLMELWREDLAAMRSDYVPPAPLEPSTNEMPKKARQPLKIHGADVYFTALEMVVFSALFNARGGFVTRERLMEVAYGNRKDGGPNDNIITVTLTRVRAKLKPTEFRIHNEMGRGWRLSRLCELIDVASLEPLNNKPAEAA